MTCIVLPDVEALEAAAVRRIVLAAARAQAQHGSFHFALAGGSTPAGVYRRLASAHGLDWRRVRVFWGDERAVPANHPESNQHLARTTLLEHVPIPPEQIHPMPAQAGDLEAAAREYEALLHEHLGSPPRLDLVLLGLGADGHTASLFPGGDAVREASRWVVAAAAPVIAPRLTLTPPLLATATALLFLVTGKAKAAALRRVLYAPHDPVDIPPHALPRAATTFLVDRAAAGDYGP